LATKLPSRPSIPVEEAIQRRIAGESVDEIARSFGIPPRAVREALDSALATASRDIVAFHAPGLLALELYRADAIYKVAFERATDPSEPDPEWAKIAEKISERRQRLLGLDKVRIQVDLAPAPQAPRLEALQPQELAMLEALLTRVVEPTAEEPVPALTAATIIEPDVVEPDAVD
jgi:hypothetical protein